MDRAHLNRMIIFDDDRGQFGPMTDLRAVFELRTGVRTTAGRIAAHRPRTLAGYWVPDRLRDLVAARANAPVNNLPDEEVLFLVNGRWAIPDQSKAPELALDIGMALLEEGSGHVIAAVLRRADAAYFLATGELHERARTRTLPERQLFRFPWDILGNLDETITHDIHTWRMADAVLPTDVGAVTGDYPVDVAPSAAIGPGVVFDAEAGPILIERDAAVRPGAVLVGPCAIGRGSTVSENAIIKSRTSIGPRCKVGGEIGGTIFQGCSNKAHHGHLGDSYVGKWVNLGAGTVNSNLLNTYGPVTVRLEPDGPRSRTGRTFLGAIFGDHVKTAIGTRIMTGTVLGTGAMVASTAPPPASVPRFAWITDDGMREYRFTKFVEVMRTVMARRGKEPGPEYIAAVERLLG